MAKFETELNGNFEDWVRWLDQEVPSLSSTTNLEEIIDKEADGVKIAVRAYERYSMSSNSRLGLTVILMDSGKQLWISAVSTGGSLAVFWKVNTWGEESFLDAFVRMLYEKMQG